MNNVTNLQDVRNSRASIGRRSDPSATLAGGLDLLHARLAELSQSLAAQLDSVERLLVRLPGATDADASSETLQSIRRSLVEVDRLRGRQREHFDILRRQRGGPGDN